MQRDFSIRTALGLAVQTAPFLIFRVLVYAGAALAVVLAAGTGGALGWVAGAFGGAEFQPGGVFWGSSLGFAAGAGAVFFFRAELFHRVTAGHIALMAELLDDRVIPGGQAQIGHAGAAVEKRFGEAASLFALDRLNRDVTVAAGGLAGDTLAAVPVPGLERVPGLAGACLRAAAGPVGGAILGHLIRTESRNPWRGSQEALVIYAQNARPVLMNAVLLRAGVWGLSLIVFLIMLAPAGFFVWLLPGTWSAGQVAFAAVFAWAAKAALIEPVAAASMLQAFFRVTQGQEPDPDWTAKLDGATVKFRTLGQRAAAWASARAARMA